MSRRARVCPHIGPGGRGCPNLLPCPIHSRRSRNWSPDRDRSAQRRLRKVVLERDGFACVRCGHRDPTGKTLVAHHVRPGYDPAGSQTLCDPCHRDVDSNAR